MKNLYVISGVGILSGSEDWNFFKNNTNSWIIFEDILNDDKLSEIQKYCIKIIATHICLSELWQNWGIKPDIIIGHSFGEISSCFISGVYNIFDTIELALKIAEEVEKEKKETHGDSNLRSCHGNSPLIMLTRVQPKLHRSLFLDTC